MQLPVVSLAAPEAEAAAVLRDACINHGFFYLTEHGVPEAVVDAAFAAQRAFFSLPAAAKAEIVANSAYRGWTPMAEETLDPGRSARGDTHEVRARRWGRGRRCTGRGEPACLLDWEPFRASASPLSLNTQGLYFGRHVDAGSPEAALPLHGPNQWPREELVRGYRAATEAYQAAAEATAFRCLRLLALSLGLPVDHFAPFFTRPMVFLRPLHYSAERSDVEGGVWGAGAHTDYGAQLLLTPERALVACRTGQRCSG